MQNEAGGNERPLAGKTAIVTGASRGIGRAIAVLLARQGASVLLTARDTAQLARAVQEIRALGEPRLRSHRTCVRQTRRQALSRKRFGFSGT